MFHALGCCLSQFHKPSTDSAFAGKVLQPVKAMYKNNKFTVILPMVVAAAIVIGILLGGLVFKSASPIPRKGNLAVPGGGKLDMLMSLIANRYVDTVSLDSITEKAIPLILDELDPHSVYVPAKDMAAMNESLDGEFDGIGVMFNMATDTVIVLNVINAGPSAKAGVLGGDRIIKINDTVVAGVKMSQDEVMKRLRGPRGSQVKLGIQRIGVKELVPITVTRGVIPIHCINAAYMITPEIGYVVFAQFSRTAYRELMNAISLLQSQGMKKLILDLRGNPGGFLDQAIAIANEFLPANRMIVYTEERGGLRQHQFSNGKGKYQDLELAILVDESSASSSEILAGALQDNDCGTIIGRRTFGKGLVQEQIPFSDGSAVRLTIARYYTPSGRSIQKPYDKGREAYNNDLINRFEHNEMFSADSIRFADSLKFQTVGGRTVYGGGGIMPDKFVPADTSDITPYLREVTGRNILYRFTIEYADRHRDELNNITSLQQLQAFFDKDPNLLEEFIRYAAKAGVAPKAAQIAKSKAIILAQIKAYIGRNTPLEDNAFYYELQDIDNTIQEAIHLLSQPESMPTSAQDSTGTQH